MTRLRICSKIKNDKNDEGSMRANIVVHPLKKTPAPLLFIISAAHPSTDAFLDADAEVLLVANRAWYVVRTTSQGIIAVTAAAAAKTDAHM